MWITTTSQSGTTVRGLGEIGLRVKNLDAMLQFYEEVIRLPLMTRFPNYAFFKIADGMVVTLKSSRCSIDQIAPVRARRMQQLRPLITLHSRYLSPISRTN